MVFGAASTIGAAWRVTDIPDSESADGFDVLEQYFAELGGRGASGTIVFRADQGIEDPAVVAGMEDLFATVNAGFPDDNGNPQHPGATVVSPTPSRARRRSPARVRWPGSSPTPRSTSPPMST